MSKTETQERPRVITLVSSEQVGGLFLPTYPLLPSGEMPVALLPAPNRYRMPSIYELNRLSKRPREAKVENTSVKSLETKEMIDKWIGYYFVGGEELEKEVAAPSEDLLALNEKVSDENKIPDEERTALFKGVKERSSSSIKERNKQLIVSWVEYDERGKPKKTHEFSPLDFSESLLVEVFGSYDFLYRPLRSIFTQYFVNKYPSTVSPEQLRSFIERDLAEMVYSFLYIIAEDDSTKIIGENIKSGPILNLRSTDVLAYFIKVLAKRNVQRHKATSADTIWNQLNVTENAYLSRDFSTLFSSQLDEVIRLYTIVRTSLLNSHAEFAFGDEEDEQDGQVTLLLPDFSEKTSTEIFENIMIPSERRWIEPFLQFLEDEGKPVQPWSSEDIEYYLNEMVKSDVGLLKILKAQHNKEGVIREFAKRKRAIEYLLHPIKKPEPKLNQQKEPSAVYFLPDAAKLLAERLNEEFVQIIQHILQQEDIILLKTFISKPDQLRRYLMEAVLGVVVFPTGIESEEFTYRDMQWMLAGLMKDLDAEEVKFIDDSVEGVPQPKRDDTAKSSMFKRIESYKQIKNKLLGLVSFPNTKMTNIAIEQAFALSDLLFQDSKRGVLKLTGPVIDSGDVDDDQKAKIEALRTKVEARMQEMKSDTLRNKRELPQFILDIMNKQ